VKNNLQMIDGLLLLQSKRLSDAGLRSALEGLRGRISALGLVHHQLMGSDDLSAFDMAPFLRQLVANLAEANADPRICVTVRAASIDLGLDVAIPLGLLVTEFVTNAFKHAFPAGQGAIEITLDARPQGGVELVVRDDGQGFELEAVRKRRGLGADIIRGLVAQLGAELKFSGADGSRFEIRLPPPTA
jgi:two-component sensor histidine kinase